MLLLILTMVNIKNTFGPILASLWGLIINRFERMMLAYLARREILKPGDLLLLDNESALKTEEVKYFHQFISFLYNK